MPLRCEDPQYWRPGDDCLGMSMASAPAAAYPTAPSTINELGIPASLIEDIILQRLVLDGRSSVTRMAAATALSVSIVDSIVDGLRQRLLLEIQGMDCLLYTSPSPRDKRQSRMPSSA